MFKFGSDNLQASLNTKSRRSRRRFFGTVRVYRLALLAAISLFMGAAIIHAEELFVSSTGSNDVLLYNGNTGNFINVFVRVAALG